MVGVFLADLDDEAQRGGVGGHDGLRPGPQRGPQGGGRPGRRVKALPKILGQERPAQEGQGLAVREEEEEVVARVKVGGEGVARDGSAPPGDRVRVVGGYMARPLGVVKVEGKTKDVRVRVI
jgi:hypothetical protein